MDGLRGLGARGRGRCGADARRRGGVAGRGLKGDRYHDGKGYYSYHEGPIREVSLIEEETLEGDHGMEIAPGELCEHLIEMTGKQGLLPDLIHCRGLHARVVKSGSIRPGDTVEGVLTGEAT